MPSTLQLNMIMPIYDGQMHLDQQLAYDHVQKSRKLADKKTSLKASARLKEITEKVWQRISQMSNSALK